MASKLPGYQQSWHSNKEITLPESTLHVSQCKEFGVISEMHGKNDTV